MGSLRDLTKLRFGRLVVVERIGTKSSQPLWICICDCGKLHESASKPLVNGNTKSCGCLRREMVAEKNKTHGLSKLPEYSIWCDIKKRCENPKSANFKYYGERGIKLSESWQDFKVFYSDMGPRPAPDYSVERLDVNKNYEKSNCVWIPLAEQARNKTNTVHVEVNGKKMILADLARMIGAYPARVSNKIKAGMSGDEVFEEHVLKQGASDHA